MLITIVVGLAALGIGVTLGVWLRLRQQMRAAIINGDFSSGMSGWTALPNDVPEEDPMEGHWPDPRIHHSSVEPPVGNSSYPVLVIGHLNGRDGAQHAGASQTFECGASEAAWCTITFEAKLDAAPGERAVVSIANRQTGRLVRAEIPAGTVTPAPYGSPPPEGFWTYQLSLQGCDVLVGTFRLESAGADAPGSQSTLMIRRVRSECGPNDLTNSGAPPVDPAPWHRRLDNVQRR